jgi:3-oxoadipate enol-lactonase
VTRTIEVGGIALVVDVMGGRAPGSGPGGRAPGSGPGDRGRPLLAVHGFCGCRDDFAPLLPALVGAGWQVAAADNRGHGDSAQPADEADYDLDRFAGDVLGLAAALGWDRFVLLGHSLGGAIAQVAALAAPERVDALVLVSTTPGTLDLDPATMALAADIVRRDGLDRLIELLKEREDPLGTPAHERAVATIPGYRERGERNVRRCSPAMYARMMDQFATMPDRSEALAGLRCPTLVVVGEQDRAMLAPSRRLAAAIPGARLEVLDDAGHAPQFEATAAMVDVLVRFLASDELSRSAPGSDRDPRSRG